MSDYRTKFKRQTEILSLIISNKDKLTYTDLAVFFNCEEITLKRDLQDLRKLGISIFCSKRRGIYIDNKVDNNLISDLINQYISMSIAYSDFNRATRALVQKLSAKSLEIIVQIQKAIDENKMLKIFYAKTEREKSERIIEPAALFVGENAWRLLAKENSNIKQFLIYKISNVEILNKKAIRIDKKEIEEILKSSLNAWIGTKQYEVTLEFLNEYGARALPFIFESQEISETKNRIVKLKVNSLDEMARWVLARGGEVIVHEPDELKKIIFEYAKNILKKIYL